MLCNLISYILQ
ncbi:unnamed protein product [Acanthoscelides obtectus]|uniref:Uncharacterized protein n=1 Tax=Acanthoscelides obtectus TaxID=200917 RepID=A0A9P0QG39_ACAOB|nr:unnamed protein product [Acanthoscelides obtectus]CAK1682759.1 hypothetical protein AOBTE_LOCUS33858 [Acanthoscelides obtectus]